MKTNTYGGNIARRLPLATGDHFILFYVAAVLRYSNTIKVMDAAKGADLKRILAPTDPEPEKATTFTIKRQKTT